MSKMPLVNDVTGGIRETPRFQAGVTARLIVSRLLEHLDVYW